MRRCAVGPGSGEGPGPRCHPGGPEKRPAVEIALRFLAPALRRVSLDPLDKVSVAVDVCRLVCV